MKKFLVAAFAVAALVVPASAQADSPICHDGSLSNDAGQGCADGLYSSTYSGGSTSPTCSDGILSNDRGLNCPDGLYERAYGSGTATASVATTASANTTSGVGSIPSGYGGINPQGYPVPPASIAQCESGGDPSINTGNGFHGKWQFTSQTWHAVTGLPGEAESYPESVQDQAAAELYANGAGAGNWPVCSQR